MESQKILVATSIAPRNIENQQNAINSWINAGFEVISCNIQAEIDLLESKFQNVCFTPVTRDASAQTGKPLVFIYDIMQELKRHKNDICGIINSDIHIKNTDEGMYKFILKEAEDSLLYGHRYDISDINDIYGTWFNGIDFFFFDSKLIDMYPDDDMFIGGPEWDFWMVFIAMHFGGNAKELCTPIAYHIKHNQVWSDFLCTMKIRKNALKYFNDYRLKIIVKEFREKIYNNPVKICYKESTTPRKVWVVLSSEQTCKETLISIENQTHKNINIISGNVKELPFFADVMQEYVLYAMDGFIYNRKFISLMLEHIHSEQTLTCQVELTAPQNTMLSRNRYCSFGIRQLLRLPSAIINGCTLIRADAVDKMNDLEINYSNFIDECLVSIGYYDYLAIIIKHMHGKRVYIYGAGKTATDLINSPYANDIYILGVVDTNTDLHGSTINEIPIVNRNVLYDELSYDVVIICSIWYESEIFNDIKTFVPEEKIVLQFFTGTSKTTTIIPYAKKLSWIDVYFIGTEEQKSNASIVLRKSLIGKNASAGFDEVIFNDTIHPQELNEDLFNRIKEESTSLFIVVAESNVEVFEKLISNKFIYGQDFIELDRIVKSLQSPSKQ